MAPTVTISTPSPPGSVRTPGTPKHGYGDSWEPFSPRKSARISARQQSTTRTPSPRSSTQSTRTYTKPSSQFSTPATSPIKKRMPTMDSVRRASSNLPAQSTTNAGDSLGPNSKKVQPKLQAASTSASMLLTPVKTPRKQPSAKTEAASRAIARPLFAAADEETMLSPKKKVKKYTGLTLDSFRAEEVEEDIEIFTDTRDHFPEKDNSAENPFSSSYVAPEPSRRRSKRRAIAVPGEGKQAVEDAVRRSDGVLVVFRGKKIFRKFSDIHDVESDSQAENEEAFESDVNSQTRRNRPMAPSSIKPRLLFRSEAKGKQAATTAPTNIEDEEAVTDIEDNVFTDARNVEVEVDVPETPIQVTESKAETPDAPRFAPASPPSTARVTRSTDKLRGETSLKQARIPSPFDGWRRSKSRAGPQGQKREGDALVKSAGSAKRQRT